MANEIKKIAFKNEKKNFKVSVRKEYTKEIREKIVSVLTSALPFEVGETERKSVYILIGEDTTTGEEIYMDLKLSMTDKQPTDKKGKKNKKDEEKEEIPSLF